VSVSKCEISVLLSAVNRFRLRPSYVGSCRLGWLSCPFPVNVRVCLYVAQVDVASAHIVPFGCGEVEDLC
jgi:hypothetical protein